MKEKGDIVFNRLTATELNPAERNTALCCNADRYHKSSCNFLGQKELMAKFDSTLMRHENSFINNENRCHYVSSTLQNDFTQKLP